MADDDKKNWNRETWAINPMDMVDGRLYRQGDYVFVKENGVLRFHLFAFEINLPPMPAGSVEKVTVTKPAKEKDKEATASTEAGTPG